MQVGYAGWRPTPQPPVRSQSESSVPLGHTAAPSPGFCSLGTLSETSHQQGRGCPPSLQVKTLSPSSPLRFRYLVQAGQEPSQVRSCRKGRSSQRPAPQWEEPVVLIQTVGTRVFPIDSRFAQSPPVSRHSGGLWRSVSGSQGWVREAEPRSSLPRGLGLCWEPWCSGSWLSPQGGPANTQEGYGTVPGGRCPVTPRGLTRVC